MQLLVTGATGRVGSRFVPRALEHGDSVRIREELGFRPRYPSFAAARDADAL